MPIIDRLLGILGLGATIANVALLKRFLAGVTIVIALTAISSTMVGMLLIMGLYGLYMGLVHYGFDQEAAIITVSALALTVTAVLVALAIMRWRELKEMPDLMKSPIINEAGKLADAFMDGFLGSRR